MVSNKKHKTALKLIKLQEAFIASLLDQISGEMDGMRFIPGDYMDLDENTRLAAQDLVKLPLMDAEGKVVRVKNGRIFAFDSSRVDSVHVHHEEWMNEHIGWFAPDRLKVVNEHG